ncbi:MAG: nucleotidyltransferase family protein [Candidatus Omnitrophota bacterium]
MLKAVILAGGRGERLRPLTDNLPKPMVDIKGRPFLEHQIGLLKKSGISEILLCVGYLKESIIDHFQDGSQLGVKIEYSIEEEPAGTGGALIIAKDLLPEEFFLFNGDSYLPIEYSGLADFWYQCGSYAGVIVCYENTERIAKNNISLDSAGCVSEYDKRSQKKNLRYVDAGVSIFKKEILEMIPAGRVVSIEEEIFPLLIKEKRLIGYPTSQRYYDMGTPDRLREIEGALK